MKLLYNYIAYQIIECRFMASQIEIYTIKHNDTLDNARANKNEQ